MNRLRGNFQATIDAKGRLKLPTAFKRYIDEQYGREVFVTSLRGHTALVYPIQAWEKVEDKLISLSQSHPIIERYRRNTSFFGQQSAMDPQGRVLIPATLREHHEKLCGEVYVLGNIDHLIVAPRDQMVTSVHDDPFTDEDAKVLAELGF